MLIIQKSNNYLINWTTAPINIKEKTKEQSSNSWLRAFISFAGSLAINFGLSFVTAGVSLILEPLIQIAWDSFLDYVVYREEFNGVDFAINALINSIPLISAGAKKLYQSSKNGVRALTKNAVVKSLNYSDELADIAKQIERFGTKGSKASYKNLNVSDLLLDSLKTKKAYDTTRAIKLLSYSSKLRLINKEIQRTRKIISAVSSPSYLVKKFFDKTIQPYKKQITNLVNTKYDELVKKLLPKIKKPFELKQLAKIEKRTFIPLNSHWIQGIQFMSSVSPTLQNFKIYFKEKVHKKPITVMNKDFIKSYGIVNAISPGQYYLNNFAWGWDIGKLLRFNSSEVKSFQKASSELYRAFNNFIFSYKSFYSLTQLQKNWSLENISKQIKQGTYQALFNWNSIKPVKFIGQTIRAATSIKPMNLLKKFVPRKAIRKAVSVGTKYTKLKRR